MSFYRTLIATVAAFGLATSVFAADESATQSPADASATTQTTATTTSDAGAVTQINLNTATVDELAKVSGLTKAKATKIVQYRDKNGNFNSLDDLKKVKGLGLHSKQLKKVQGQLTVG